MKLAATLFVFCFFTVLSAQAETPPKKHAIFGQWLTMDHNDNKKYRSIVMDNLNKKAKVFECTRGQSEGGIELSVVVCKDNKATRKFLNYNKRSDSFWFSQNRTNQLQVDRSGDVMIETSSLGLVKTEWYRVYDPMVEFVYIK